MPLLMIRNDITKMQVDAIVNPANKELKAGRGTSWAIYSAAGEKELTAACEKIGFCEAGKAVLTKGYALPAKFIIHAVCPPWTGDGKEKERLAQAYRSALRLAAEYHFKSVAFPLLSSGFYGWPKADAFHTATTVISEFLLESDMTVYLVLYDHESVEVSKKLFSQIEEYIDDHYVGEHDEMYGSGTVPDGANKVPPYIEVHETAAQYPNFSAPPSHKKASEPIPATNDEVDLKAERVCENVAEYMPAMSGSANIPQEDKKRFFEASPVHTAPAKKNGKKKLEFPTFLKKSSSFKERKLDELMANMDETFSQMLLRLIDERGLKDSVVYHKANIDRRLFSKIRNDVNYAPTKKTVVAFAIALELTLDETKDLLMRAGFAFSNSSKFDVIVSFFIENRQYNIFEINEVLFAYGQPILGE